MAKKEGNNVKCSFCGKLQDEVERIVAGPGVYICNECIDVCANIVESEDYEDEDIREPVSGQPVKDVRSDCRAPECPSKADDQANRNRVQQHNEKPVHQRLEASLTRFVGLFEELTFRVTINDALLYSFRNKKL